ncbi:MAG: hypothetical protein A2048_10860 [Deltaproteobacteria bacterium GWA2_45_12]|nr:MAG: hypothetical protein A2048_10860 [Deltaproteobacteria bacterium GWA2_45_12]
MTHRVWLLKIPTLRRDGGNNRLGKPVRKSAPNAPSYRCLADKSARNRDPIRWPQGQRGGEVEVWLKAAQHLNFNLAGLKKGF